jgi:hypothetical protein
MLPELGLGIGHIRSIISERLLAEKIASENAKAATRAKKSWEVKAAGMQRSGLTLDFQKLSYVLY